MNKGDLIDFVADKAQLTKKDATSAINAAFEGIIEALKSGKEARFVGFGSFGVVTSTARKGRNPRTGEEINIAAARHPKFKAGKEFKAAVN